MPKLRERKTPSAPAPSSEGEPLRYDNYSREETNTLLAAIRQYGTGDVQKLTDILGTRTRESVKSFLRRVRRQRCETVPEAQQSTPLDDWMDIVERGHPQTHWNQRTDQRAVTCPLLLAALEEDRLAAEEHRESLAGVYRFLAEVASGVVPAEPKEADACRLIALMHHLVALIRTTNLTIHKRWLWNGQRIQKLITGDTTAEVAAPSADLSVVPAELRTLIGQLLDDSNGTNPLHIPAAQVITPLATQLNVTASGDDHLLLGDPDRLWEKVKLVGSATQPHVEAAESSPSVTEAQSSSDSPSTEKTATAGPSQLTANSATAGNPRSQHATPSGATANRKVAQQAVEPGLLGAGLQDTADMGRIRPKLYVVPGARSSVGDISSLAPFRPRNAYQPLKMPPGGWIRAKSNPAAKKKKQQKTVVHPNTGEVSGQGESPLDAPPTVGSERSRVQILNPETPERLISAPSQFPTKGVVRSYSKRK